MLQRNIFYLLALNLHCIFNLYMYEIKIEDKINIKIMLDIVFRKLLLCKLLLLSSYFSKIA
jgi:hypothetical protein